MPDQADKRNDAESKAFDAEEKQREQNRQAELKRFEFLMPKKLIMNRKEKAIYILGLKSGIRYMLNINASLIENIEGLVGEE